MWHIIEEDFLHRGEVICMLWQDDIEPPYTGHFWWEYDTNPGDHQYLYYSNPMAARPSPGGYVSPKGRPKRPQEARRRT